MDCVHFHEWKVGTKTELSDVMLAVMKEILKYDRWNRVLNE